LILGVGMGRRSMWRMGGGRGRREVGDGNGNGEETDAV
jgi:hypothetical protein